MDATRLRERIEAPVVHRDSLPSTNDVARRRGRDGDPGGTFVVADEQTAGRGRTGNRWASPPGGVWSSTLLRPDFAAAHAGRLTFAGGLAAAETVEAFDVPAALKWPNDVVVPRSDPGDPDDPGGPGDPAPGGGRRPDVDAADGAAGGRKVAGVLTEAVVDSVPVAGKPVDEVIPGADPDAAALDFAVLGVGVNAALDPADLDADRAVATLRDERGEGVDPVDVAATLHDRLLAWTDRVETADGFAAALDAWREYSATLGERVRIEVRGDQDPVVGRAVDVSERGALLVDDGDERVEVTEGECEKLRPV